MIRFEGVTKTYSNGYEALSNVSFALEPGEMVFLTGHSGAGKSTLLKLLAMIEKPTQGRVFIEDICLNKLRPWHKPRLRQRIGMIFQNPRLLENHSVYENVALPLVISGYQRSEIKRRVRAALDKVDLLRKEQLLPNSLSGGEQQRVGIARAIVHKPTILLADEPTGNLDPKLSEEIMFLFQAFNQVGVTVLVASHDLGLIGSLKHRILTLHQGKMVSTGVQFSDEKNLI
jgi:cell division transport system ATP-binding protein